MCGSRVAATTSRCCVHTLLDGAGRVDGVRALPNAIAATHVHLEAAAAAHRTKDAVSTKNSNMSSSPTPYVFTLSAPSIASSSIDRKMRFRKGIRSFGSLRYVRNSLMLREPANGLNIEEGTTHDLV